MRRRIAILLLLLVGGAIVNVAVAWGVVQELYVFIFPPTTFRQYPPEVVANMSREVGWPLPALRGWDGNEEHDLPLRPIVPGFIINTLFYALLLWLLFFTPFAARRMLRRRRGQCEKCAYPIGVSPVCTECGAAVSRSEARARRNEPRA